MQPDQAAQGAQSEEQNASTPATPDKQTTATTQKGVMDLLGIPAEVQAQVEPKLVDPKFGSDIPGEFKGETAAAPEPATKEDAQAEPEVETQPDRDGDEDEDEGDEETQPAAEGERPDKRQKRINRLTRRKRELETLADQLATENEALKKQLGTTAENLQKIESGIITGKRLSEIDRELAQARGIVAWCDENSEGATIGEGETEKFLEPKEIAGWKREATEQQFIALQERREEVKALKERKAQYDELAQKSWPEIFDKSTKEYQVAASILEEYPWLNATPEVSYAVGLVMEGMKSVQSRVKNGEAPRQHRDIDERAFSTPRMPIAPHGPGAPSREAAPSSGTTKEVNEAMSKLVKDPDGGAASLANAFGALARQEARSGRGGRAPVRS